VEIVLVHGGMHGAWCWETLSPLLRAAGHVVSAPDLPGMGKDRTPLHQVTLASSADALADHVRKRANVLLVGHSMAGPVISECAERVPSHLLGLVYIAANLVPSGQSMHRAAGANLEAVMSGVIASPDGVSVTYKPESAIELFYNATERAIAERAVARLAPQSLEPMMAPLKLTEERFGLVPRAYIECLRDRVNPIAFQRQMQETLPCDPVITMDCDHSPFLSKPHALEMALTEIAREFGRRDNG
jgi:pimeloyl-ACP methyl ester carboxylesterase